MNKWNYLDTAASYREGWSIFYLDDKTYNLQKLDDPDGVADEFGYKYQGPRFPHDEAAMGYVKERAGRGNKLAKKALDFLRENTPSGMCI